MCRTFFGYQETLRAVWKSKHVWLSISRKLFIFWGGTGASGIELFLHFIFRLCNHIWLMCSMGKKLEVVLNVHKNECKQTILINWCKDLTFLRGVLTKALVLQKNVSWCSTGLTIFLLNAYTWPTICFIILQHFEPQTICVDRIF